MLSPAQTTSPNKYRFYLIEQFFLKNGTQPARIHEFFSKVLLPAMEKALPGPRIILEALAAPHMPQVAVVAGCNSVDGLFSASRKMFAMEGVTAGFEGWEAGDEPPYESSTVTVLEAASFSPEIAVPSTPPKTPRIFELRVYHSPTYRQLRALHERFAGPEIQIFHRVGVHPILYGSTVFGANRPNLTYLTPFESLAAREKAWNAFAGDEEWVKVRKESIDKHGQISSVIQISLYRATPYSPIR